MIRDLEAYFACVLSGIEAAVGKYQEETWCRKVPAVLCKTRRDHK